MDGQCSWIPAEVKSVTLEQLTFEKQEILKKSDTLKLNTEANQQTQWSDYHGMESLSSRKLGSLWRNKFVGQWNEEHLLRFLWVTSKIWCSLTEHWIYGTHLARKMQFTNREKNSVKKCTRKAPVREVGDGLQVYFLICTGLHWHKRQHY